MPSVQSVRRRSYALFLLLSVLVAGCGTDAGRTPRATASDRSPATRVVPWADLPAGHQRVPTTWIAATPDPAPAERAPACRADRLRATRSAAGGAGGTLYWSYAIRSRGGPPCAVSGTPAVVPLTNGAPDGVPVRAVADSGPGTWGYRHPVLLDRTHTATLRIAWGEDWCTTPVRVDAVRFAIADGTVAAPGLGTSPVCNGGAGPTPISVWPLFPSGYREGRVTPAWDEVGVRAPSFRHLTGAPGSTLRFTVTLRSPQDLPLDACPDYQIDLVGDGDRALERHRLNCAAVPFHGANGTPYLPAHRDVTFAMRVTAPDSPAPKSIWRIALPTGGRHGLAVDGMFTPAPETAATP